MTYKTVPAAYSASTILPSFDVETFSCAGYVWNAATLKWGSLPSTSTVKRGLSTVGTRKYVQDPTFLLLCLNFNLQDGKGGTQWVEGDPPPSRLILHVGSGEPLAAWNANFEYTVWQYYCVPRLGWPPLREDQMRCTMAKARAWGLPGKLENAGDVLNIVHKKDKDGDRLIRKFSIPRNPTKKDPRLAIRPWEDAIDGPKFYAYNSRDVEAEIEIGSLVPDLSAEEQQIWQVDQQINRRGIGLDVEAVENCIVIVEQAYERYNGELERIAGCKASETEQLQTWLHNQGWHMDDLTEESVEAALKRQAPPHVHRALELRSMLASASVKKLFAMRAQEAQGRLYDLYSYSAARTRRWAGMGPQPQNLYSGEWPIEKIERALEVISYGMLDLVEYEYGDALTAVNNCQRSLLIAKPGHELICSDFSSIEAVVIAMLAGEQWRIDVFRGDGLIYEAAAERMGICTKDEMIWHKREMGVHHPARKRCKVAELASAYGGFVGAWMRFGADEFYDSEDEIKQAILAWRSASPMIVEFWGGQTRDLFNNPYQEYFGLEGAAVKAVLSPGTAYAYRSITFQVYNDVLYMRLPSGGLLVYHKPRLAPSTRPYMPTWELSLTFEGWNSNPQKGAVGWVRMGLYSGLIAENATQAVARDIQAHALVNLEQGGYPVVLHTHDEICSEVPQGFGSIEEFESIMCRMPAWAHDWPIRTGGGWRGRRYRK